MIPAQSPEPVPSAPARGPFPRAEGAGLLAVLVAFVGVLAATTLAYQPVWLDEVTVADPAVNLYLGKGFTSTGWQYQTKEEFWASNAPLHQILLYHWIKVFGFTPVSVRSISFLLMAATIALVWLGVWRWGLIRTPLVRFLLVGLMIGGAGITFNFSMGRYDCIGILLFAGALVITSLEGPFWIRALLLMGVGILIPMAGVNLLPYGALLGGLLLFYLRREFVREAVCLGAGILLGLFGLYVLYVTNGVEKVLLVSAGGHGLAGTLGDDAGSIRTAGLGEKIKFVLTHFPRILMNRLSNLPRWYLSDYSFVLILALLGVRSTLLRRSRKLALRSIPSFGLAVAILVPLLLGLLRDYPFYYSWMAYLPVAICTMSACDGLWNPPSRLLTRAAVGAVVLLAFWQGLPARLSWALRHPAPDHAKVEQFVRAGVSKSDRAYADFEAYYPMQRSATYVLLPTYQKMMSRTEKSELTVLVVRAPNVAEVTAVVGGSWREVASLDQPVPYDLRILRRP